MIQLKTKDRLRDHQSDDLAERGDLNTTSSQGAPNWRPNGPMGTDESPPYGSPPPAPWPRIFPQL